VTEADPRSFRDVLGRFASGVTVVTTREDGVDHAVTVSAFTSVSLAPPLVLVCIDVRNRFHEPVIRTGRWSVSLLAEGNQAASTWLATRGRPLEDQLDQVPHRRGEVHDAALVEGALGWLECETWQVYPGADHSIVVGLVRRAEVDRHADSPLLYYRSHYGSLVESDESEKSSS